MTKGKSYHKYLIQSLKDPKRAVEYLNTALEEGDPKFFLMALRHVAEAKGGLGNLSKKTKLNRENLYRMLSKFGNPALYSLEALLKVLGLRLLIGVRAKKVS